MSAVSDVFTFGQRMGKEVLFINEKRTGPDHCPRFTVQVRIGEEVFPEGEGRNKKSAREAAAEEALEELKKQGPLPEKRLRERRSGLLSCLTNDSLSGLREYARAHGEDLLELIEETGPADARRFSCQFTMGGRSFLPMSSCTRQQAKEEAAQAAMAVILGEEEQEMRTNPQPSTSSSFTQMLVKTEVKEEEDKKFIPPQNY